MDPIEGVIWVADRELALTAAQVRRFWSKVECGDVRACWLWTGRLDRDGYGVFTVKRAGRSNLVSAHRVAFMLTRGQVATGLQLDHTCRIRACANPSHVDPVTSRENTMRSPIAPAAVLSRSVIADAYIDSNGHRHSRPGRAAASARWRAKQAS